MTAALAKDLRAVAALIAERFGLALLPLRKDALAAALAGLGARLSGGDLAAHLAADPTLLIQLVGEVVVPESYFFRDSEQFDIVRTQILPELCARRPETEPLVAWSAGCAAGEEAYSLAIALEEARLAHRVRIVATDISQRALAAAARGLYRPWSLRDTDESFRARYFRPAGDRYELDERIRRRVQFAQDNLVAEEAESKPPAYDLILCRNVMVYFDTAAVTRVAWRLFRSLRPGGWLVTGPSDPLVSGLVPLRSRITQAGLLYYKDVHADQTYGPYSPARGSAGEGSAGSAHPGATRDAIERAKRALAQGDYAAASTLTQGLLDSADACAVFVQALANAGDLSAAERALRERMDRHPLAPELHFLHAVLLSSENHLPAAYEAAKRVLYLDRSLVAGHLLCAHIEERRGRLTSALSHYRNAATMAQSKHPDDILPLTDGQRAAEAAAFARDKSTTLMSLCASLPEGDTPPMSYGVGTD